MDTNSEKVYWFVEFCVTARSQFYGPYEKKEEALKKKEEIEKQIPKPIYVIMYKAVEA